MPNNRKVTERVYVDSQITTVTSAAGATSIPIDMKRSAEAGFIMRSEGATFGRITYDLMESSRASAAGSSGACGCTGLEVGSSVNTSIPSSRGVQSMYMVCGTAGTGATGDAITIGIGTVVKTYVWTTSTALYSISTNATKCYYGSTVGSTVNTGQQLAMGMLASALRSTLTGFGDAIIATTPATNSILLQLQDGINGALSFGATGDTHLIVSEPQAAGGAFNITSDGLSTGKRWLSIKCSTSATSVRTAITSIRTGKRYGGGRPKFNTGT